MTTVSHHRHRGVTAVLSAIIIFAMIAVLVVGIFAFMLSNNLMLNQAAQTEQGSQIALAGEHLSLAVARYTSPPLSPEFGIRVSNTGSVPSTITAVYVTSPSGQALSQGASGSEYLIGPTALNITLPLSILPGASTSTMTACSGKACNIGIYSSALAYSGSGDVEVSVLTRAGNLFTVQYPASVHATTTMSTSTGGTTTTTLPGGSESTTTFVTSSTTQSWTASSTTVVPGQGTPALVLSLSATCTTICASQSVLNTGTITVTGTVTNLATSPATAVSIVMSPLDGYATGTASVTPSGGCSPSSGTVGAGGYATFTCVYTATTGTSGGTITFDGYAAGTVSGNAETSADAASNTLQIGYSATGAPVTISPYSFNFTSVGQTAVGHNGISAALISDAASYVALYVQVTNVYGQPLTIMNPTDISTQSPYVGADPAFYMVCGPTGSNGPNCPLPSYSGNSGTFTPYNCYPGSAYSGVCITIPVSGSVTLVFAACNPGYGSGTGGIYGSGSSNWVWYSASGSDNLREADGTGCGSPSLQFAPPVGSSVAFVLFYTIGSTTSGALYSSLLPLSSMFVTLPTNLAVSCPTVALGEGTGLVTCTGVVTCNDSPYGSTNGSPTTGCTNSHAPIGNLAFTATPSSGLSPTSTQCSLVPSGTQAQCSVTFTPSVTGTFTNGVSASYGGDSEHGSSSGSGTVTVNPYLSAGTITPPAPTTHSGQPVTLTASWTGGTPNYQVTWYSGTSPTCSSDTIVVATHSGITGTTDTESVSPTSNMYYCAVVTDSSSVSATDTAILVTVQYQVTFAQSGLDSSATGTVVTVNSVAETYANLPYSIWVTSGQSVSFSFTQYVTSSTSGKQFALTPPSQTSPYTVNSAVTITGTYTIQYQATFAQSGLDSSATGTVVTVNTVAETYTALPYSVWVNSGGSVTFSFTQYVTSSTSGKQFALTPPSQTSPYTVTGPVTITGTYTTQYQVTMAVSPSGAGTTSPSVGTAWENAGSLLITANANSGHLFSSWSSSTGSIVIASSTSASTTATISGPGTITANFVTAYTATFDAPVVRTAGDVSSSTTVITVTIGGSGSTCTGGTATAVPQSALPESFTMATGTDVCYSYSSPVASTSGNDRYVWSSTTGTGSASGVTAQSGSFTISATSTVTAAYTIQYQATFAQSGLDSSATGTVVTVNTVAETYTALPYSVWVNSGGSVTFSFTQYVTSSTSGKQFALTPPSQTSPYTVNSAVTITGTYTIQYQVTFNDSPTSGGSITAGGTAEASGTTAWENAGSLSITATPASGHKFISWTGSGSITITTPASASTTATISGTGTITATFSGGTYAFECKATGTHTGSTSFTVSISGCSAGDILFVVVTENSGTASMSGVSGSVTGAYTLRASKSGSSETIFEYYTTTTSATSQTLTISVSASHTYNVQAFGISGVCTTSGVCPSPLFDTGASYALPNSGTTGKPTVSGIITSNANDIIIAMEADTRSSSQSVGTIAGATANSINLYNTGSLSDSAEYVTVTAINPSPGTSATFGTTVSSGGWAMLVDAIDPPSGTAGPVLVAAGPGVSHSSPSFSPTRANAAHSLPPSTAFVSVSLIAPSSSSLRTREARGL